MRTIAVLLVLLLTAAPARGQGTSDADMLQWSSRVGQMLYRYFRSLDAAAAAVEQRSTASTRPPLYAGGLYDDGWAFSFGAFEGDSAFVIQYGVIVDGRGEVASFERFEQRRVASPYHTAAARALSHVLRDFQERQHEMTSRAGAYRIAVLPFPSGQLTAFVAPRQTQPGVTLAGSDRMYALERSTGRVLSHTRFHHFVIPLPRTPPPGGTAALLVPDAPIPSPVDVLHAMERGDPLLVLTASGAFRIDPDGTLQRLPDDDPVAQALRGGTQ